MLKKTAFALSLLLFCQLAAAATAFQVVSIALSENSVEEGHTSPIDIDITVKNQGGSSGICYLQLEVFDKDANPKQPPILIQSPAPLGANGGEYTFGPPLYSALSLDVSDSANWPAGLYTVAAKACAGGSCDPSVGGEVQGSANKSLVITPVEKQPVPETSVLLLPLVVFAVLGVLFLASKR